MENDRDSHTFFVVRIDSSGFEASLEKHKIYAAFRDASMDADGDLRVSDESGESYLYPADKFVPIDVPEAVGRSMTAQC